MQDGEGGTSQLYFSCVPLDSPCLSAVIVLVAVGLRVAARDAICLPDPGCKDPGVALRGHSRHSCSEARVTSAFFTGLDSRQCAS